MFGDNERTRELAVFLLELYSLRDILEMNDISEEELLVRLLEDGMLAEPERIIQEYESDAKGG